MADKPTAEEKKLQPIIIKKIKKGGGHHGGAWKVAYADFVTAMMAFFLLLWLLNVTTDEQRNAISNYFDPTHPKISEATSGAGGVMGGLSMAKEGAMTTTVQNISVQASTNVNQRSNQKSPDKYKSNMEASTLERAKEMLRKEEEKRFKTAEEQIKKAIESDPELKELAKNLLIDMTPEGLRIQVIDQDGKPMFASGSAEMYPYTQKLMNKVATIIQKLPNDVSIRGHTDSVPYGKDAKYTNWELSTDRANSSRRVLLMSGMPPERINNVVGKADTDHLFPKTPTDARNRRISIILLKEELTNPDFEKKAEEEAKNLPPDTVNPKPAIPTVPVGTFKKTRGNIEFP
jgi:chemotaxis protein MotB